MSAWKRTEKPSASNGNVGEYRRRIGAFDLVVGSAGDFDLFASVEARKSGVEIAIGWVIYATLTDAVIAKAKRKAESLARRAGLAVPK